MYFGRWDADLTSITRSVAKEFVRNCAKKKKKKGRLKVDSVNFISLSLRRNL